MEYREWRTLETRGAVDPGPVQEVEGTLLVGTKSVLSFSDGHTRNGYDSVSIYPAFYKGERCFVRRDVWCPEYGCSASGTDEYIVSFEDGVEIFLKRGVFEFPLPKE